MAITVQYVVTHKGDEALVTTDKKEADQYDKMLDVGDNIAAFLQLKGIVADEKTLEEIGITLSKNKAITLDLLRGKPLQKGQANDELTQEV
jgi:dsDNA-binding SOS-regulon protein